MTTMSTTQLQHAAQKFSPYDLSPKIWCSTCRSYQPRGAHIKVLTDGSGLRYRIMCAKCAAARMLP